MDVTPDKQNIDMVFSNITYYIDFYQRQYKWTYGPVVRLLDDITFKFNLEFSVYKDKDISLDKLVEKYSWYYLNTYVTNTVEGKLFIVDGQQRLTTLTIILIKLYHLANEHRSELVNWISSRIVGHSGFQKDYWLNHEQHKKAIDGLFKGEDLDQIDVSSGLTAVNLVGNYKIVSNYLNQELNDKHKFESFVFYFLRRLVLINLNVEQTDVPMIFEVINDRGVRLKPYEILKGKLLGQIDKDELDQLKLNDLWDKQVDLINDYSEDEIDEFFIYFLRAKFANTVGDSKKFDQSYHRTMFTSELNQQLDLQHNPKSVKQFLQREFTYFTNLYLKILTYYESPHEDFIHVYYNGLTEMDSQFMLILSACILNDPLEKEKIKLISYQVDRLFSLLQLQRSYDSNDFNETIYKISNGIRDKDNIDEIEKVFNEYLLELLSNARSVKTDLPVTYTFFKDTGHDLNKRFKRYFFARVEHFIANGTKMNMKHSIADLVQKTGTVSGFHIEHILSVNKENLQQFGNDKERFERERNRLGGLLMLKGRDNVSSNNELYSKKLNTYANTLYWNETLRQDSYKSKKDFSNMMSTHKLNFRPIDTFSPVELEERHNLLYEMIKIIWK